MGHGGRRGGGGHGTHRHHAAHRQHHRPALPARRIRHHHNRATPSAILQTSTPDDNCNSDQPCAPSLSVPVCIIVMACTVACTAGIVTRIWPIVGVALAIILIVVIVIACRRMQHRKLSSAHPLNDVVIGDRTLPQLPSPQPGAQPSVVPCAPPTRAENRPPPAMERSDPGDIEYGPPPSYDDVMRNSGPANPVQSSL